MKSILITGGAGFIGSHVADELLQRGYRVRVLDSLGEQVHPLRQRPQHLHPDVELIRGDVCDATSVAAALKDVDAVIHFAAAVGVRQSMYRIGHYTRVNDVGTAVLLETLIEQPVQRLVVASSMSVYGEGRYITSEGQPVDDCERTLDRLEAGEWEPVSDDGRPLLPAPMPESKRPSFSSVYALTKFDQEQLCLMAGRAYGIPTVALRFFNVYGPRQSLCNPYTGVLAIFATRLLNNTSPLIFEDGEQRRDFVSVYDVARACRLALEKEDSGGSVFNIGSGLDISIREVAERLAAVMGKEIEPVITGQFRAGDVRHCYADISRARAQLGYEPREVFDVALVGMAEWLETQTSVDRWATAGEELSARGLAI